MSDHNVYEMLWDCQFCGTKKNLGLTHRFCPNCGAPQNPASRYYPSDAEKVAVKDHQFVGVDVICPACNELNSASSEFCGQCGSPLTEGARATTLEAQSRTFDEAFETSVSRDIVKERFDQQMQAIGVQPTPNKKKRGHIGKSKIAAIIGVVVLVFGALFTAFNLKKDVSVIASEHEWERVITVQEYDNFTARSWRDSPPVGDSVSMVPGSCQREQRSTRRIADGQTCRTVRQDNGDGTFSERQECTTNYREEPVYDDMCSWRGMRWEFDRDARTSGGLTTTPY
ncbi:MAG: zinc ribbon domain-containing protein [Anaerolineae bacterium]